MRPLFSLILMLALAACGPERPPAAEDGPAVGAFSPVAAGDPQVQAAASFAATALGGADARLVSIDEAASQIVAGTNYRLQITVANGLRWEAVVWRRLDGGMQLTQSRKLSPLVQPQLRLDANGVRTEDGAGEAATLRFGASQAEVLRALGWRGKPEIGTNPDCGAGPVQFAQWPDGLSLLFQHGRFGGWAIDARGRSILTNDAIHVGSHVGQLRTAGRTEIRETSLGREFTVNDINGLLDGEGNKAQVAAMWAGELSCVFG